MVYEYLTTGAENAHTSRYLCGLLGLNHRELTKQIERERRAGKPICAAAGINPGYFLAADKDEMQHYCKSLEHRENEINKTRQACIDTINELPERE